MTDTAVRTEEIQRLEAPPPEVFHREWVAANRPVVLTGVADRWPAYQRWTPEYLREKAGDSPITVHFNEHGDFHRWYLSGKERVDRSMPLGELLDLLTGEPAERRYYMTEHELSKVSPELVRDVDFGDYLIENGPYEPLLFLGRDTCMPLHYHGTTEALLCQLHGTKRIWLYSPAQFSKLYAQRWYRQSPLFSRVDGMRPDYERFPRFKGAVPLAFTLRPGEILFIPVHWWHLTAVEGFQVSVTHFWTASKRQWHFPEPGFQVVAREILYRTKRKLRGARARLRRRKSA